jgi:peroxidase
MVGPTFACIMGRQFRNFRFGDRFWYENGGWPSSFTPEQLTELRKVRLSRLICDNADDVDSVQGCLVFSLKTSFSLVSF